MLGRPASEKRRGTKSRGGGAPSVPRALWGFGRGVRLGRLDQSPCADRLPLQDGCERRAERAQRALPDGVGGVIADRFIDGQ